MVVMVGDVGTTFTPVKVGVGAGRATERVRKPTATRRLLSFMVVGSCWRWC